MKASEIQELLFTKETLVFHDDIFNLLILLKD